jgi:hypothetical protein
VADKATGVRRTPRAGEIFKNPALANTLTKLQQGGCQEFYNGSIAQAYEAYGAVSECLRVRVRLDLCPPLCVCLSVSAPAPASRSSRCKSPRGTGHPPATVSPPAPLLSNLPPTPRPYCRRAGLRSLPPTWQPTAASGWSTATYPM